MREPHFLSVNLLADEQFLAGLASGGRQVILGSVTGNVPELNTLGLLGLSLVGMSLVRRRAAATLR